MSASSVVEAVDVFEERLCYLLARLPRVTPDEFGLQCFEEGFNSGIIIAITFAAH